MTAMRGGFHHLVLFLALCNTAIAQTTQIPSPAGLLLEEGSAPAGASFSLASNNFVDSNNNPKCQKVNLPVADGTFYGMTLLRASIPQKTGGSQAGTVTWKVALYNSAGTLIGETAVATTHGTNDPNQPETADFSNTLFVTTTDTSDGVLYMCVEAVSGTIYFPTDGTQDSWIGVGAPDLGALSSAPAMVVGLVGVPHVIHQFPFVENFDSWPLCHFGGIPTCIHSNSFAPGTPEADRSCDVPYGWRNAPLGENDDFFDWITHTGPTESRATGLTTGPLYEHTNTSGLSDGRYVYVEASGGCSNLLVQYVGYLETPYIIIPGGYSSVVSVWYHMYGKSGMELHVDSMEQGDSSWTMDGPGGIWASEATNLDKRQAHNSGVNPGIDEWLQWNLDVSHFSGRSPFKLRFRGITGTQDTGTPDEQAQSDMAIDDFSIIATTNTPTPTQSATASATDTHTSTDTLTTIPTYTELHTKTATASYTETAYRGYKPKGIPDANLEVVNAFWSHIAPVQCYEDEDCSLTLNGFWLGGVDEVVEAKVAFWKPSCVETASGRQVVTTVTSCNNTAIFSVAEPGEYMVCIKHRQDWEQVRNSRLTILPKPTVDLDGKICSIWSSTNQAACEAAGECTWQSTDNTCISDRELYFGFSMCEGIEVSVPKSCGCWYQRSGADMKTVLLPYDYPTRLLTRGLASRYYLHGCCQRAHGQNVKFRKSATETWGYCTENPLEDLPSL